MVSSLFKRRVLPGILLAAFLLCMGELSRVDAFQEGGRGAAQPAEPADSSDSSVSAFDRYVVRGGWVTTMILIPLSITAFALIIEANVAIRRGSAVPPEFVQALTEALDRREYVEAIRLCGEHPSVLASVVNAGLAQAGKGYAAMERAMEESLHERGAKWLRKIEYLNVIGSVAPMVGLFGTVIGIIGMFNSIADAGGIPVMARISRELGIALVATFWGLLVAVPSLTVFGIMRNRIEVLLAECALATERLMARFMPESPEAAVSLTPHHSPTRQNA